jgi:dTMP kinase
MLKLAYMRKKGKLIVIEGLDGAGKATQTALLLKRLKKEGYKTATTDFPQYEKFFGKLVGRYLAGEFGTAEQVGPELSSILYALDRWQAADKMKKWLRDGKIIISNRYITANMIHQAGKLKNSQKRAKFLKWLRKLEFNFFGIPEPDMVIYLAVPYQIGQRLVDHKGFRKYLKGRKRDIHEKDKSHLVAAQKMAEKLTKKYHWIKINCVKAGQILPRQVIAEKVWQALHPKLRVKSK